MKKHLLLGFLALTALSCRAAEMPEIPEIPNEMRCVDGASPESIIETIETADVQCYVNGKRVTRQRYEQYVWTCTKDDDDQEVLKALGMKKPRKFVEIKRLTIK